MSPAYVRREYFGLGVIFTCVVWFYAYIGLPPLYPVRFERDSLDYYHQLVDGFMSGRLGFKIDPPPALVALADPYEPTQRAAAGNVGLHDASYYKGHYYLYFGVAPALTLFLPFKAITGFQFPQSLSTVIFCGAGYLCSLALLIGIRRRYFPQAGTGWVWVAAVMLGLGNFCTAMLARNSIWEVPIACGYFYSSLGFWLLLQGATNRTRRITWLAGASTAFGLAAASRPHFALAAVALCSVWMGWTWRRKGSARAALLREAAAVFVPLAVIGSGLLLYNYARFDNAFEFGQKYQLAGNRQIDSQLLSLRFLPINAYYYLVAPAQLERFFPFFDVIHGYPGVRPADYGGAENPYGLLVNMPCSWLALLALLLWVWKFRRDSAVGSWLLVFGLSFLVLMLAVMCFAWSANRYMVDFLPSLLLIAVMGLLMLNHVVVTSRAARVLVGIGVVGVVGYTAAFNVLIPFGTETFKAYRPQHLATLARWFNQPAYWWDRSHSQPYGPAELTVRFPLGRLGRAEPLLVSGVSYKSDYLYVLYLADGRHVQFYFSHTNYNTAHSQPIAVDFHVPHRIGIAAGSLYPAEAHPFFSDWQPKDVKTVRETLDVTLDGVPYLKLTGQHFFETSPGFVSFGENHVSDYIEPKFTGKILELRRRPLTPPMVDFPGGSFVRLGLVLPRPATGQREPLVLTGSAERNDLLFVVCDRDDRVRLGFCHAGTEPMISLPVVVQPGDVQLLEASLGSFYFHPQNARERELAQRLIVRLNGQEIWDKPETFYPAHLAAPAIGRNSLDLAAYAPRFSGRIVAQQPMQLFPLAMDSAFAFQPYWQETQEPTGYGAVRLHLVLPEPASRLEPLLVTGLIGEQADYVFINHPLADQICLGYIHAGAVPLQTRMTTINPSEPQVVEIYAPSLYPDEHDKFFAARSLAEIAETKQSRVRIRLNGQLLLDHPVLSYQTTAGKITIGCDQLVHAFGSKFTGQILAIERAILHPPPGFGGNTGALELGLVLPDFHQSTATETLLATGNTQSMDALLVEPGPNQQIRFAVRMAQGVTIASEFLPLDASQHTLKITWGGLYLDELRPASVSIVEWHHLQRNITVTLDGKDVLHKEAEFVLANPETVILGGKSPYGFAFSGRLQSIKRLK